MCFGIYPYFHELLIQKIRAVKYYTLSFDESLNEINQKKQMDMIVRFWDSESNKVPERLFRVYGSCYSSRYVGSFKKWNGFT